MIFETTEISNISETLPLQTIQLNTSHSPYTTQQKTPNTFPKLKILPTHMLQMILPWDLVYTNNSNRSTNSNNVPLESNASKILESSPHDIHFQSSMTQDIEQILMASNKLLGTSNAIFP